MSARPEPIQVAGAGPAGLAALAGFGMRYALLSGVLAARALMNGGRYESAWRRTMAPAIETSVVNRALYGVLGKRGYRWLLRLLDCADDSRRFLRLLYAPGRVRRALLPWARRRYRSKREDESCHHVDCSCVWRRCGGAGRDQQGGLPLSGR